MYHQSRFSDSYSNQIFFNFTPPNFHFPIHDDARIKCWTLAYYFYPDSNSGTTLYDINKRRVYDALWEPNSGLAFCPKNRVTWHSYENNSTEDFRVVLIMNIIRPKPLKYKLIDTFSNGLSELTK